MDGRDGNLDIGGGPGELDEENKTQDLGLVL